MEQDYKDLKACELCQKKFTLVKRPHKCKRCKLIICSDCGKTKAIIIGTKDAPDVPHRVCSVCSTDINSQKEIRETYNVSWAVLSPLGREWLKDCNVQKELAIDLEKDYAKNLKEAETNVDPNSLIIDIRDGKADREFFNYSMLEFLHSLQQGKDRESIRKNVENVLLAFYNRYPGQIHISFLVNVVVFLLCFTDEQSAFGLLCYISEKLLPKDFWNKDSVPLPFEGLQREKYILFKLSQEVLNPNGNENMKPFHITFRKVANSMLSSLMVDVVNFNTVLYVWTQMFAQKSISPLEASILKVFKLSKTYFDHHYRLSLYNYRLYVCRNIQASNLRDDYLVQVNDKEREPLSSEFTNKIIDQTLNEKENLSSTLRTLKELSLDDLNLMKKKIEVLINGVKTNKKQVIELVEMTQPTFISVLKEVPSLRNLDQATLINIFQSLDIDKQDYISSRVFLGLLNLLIPTGLTQKLELVFAQFDSAGNKTINAKEMPSVVTFLAETLAIFNEADLAYINFDVDLYEMIEKVKKKLKTMDKVTPQDFESITSKYSVFQVLGSGRRSSPRRTGSILSFVSISDNTKDDNDFLSFDKDRGLDDEEDTQGERNFNVLTNDIISPIKRDSIEQSGAGNQQFLEIKTTEELKAENLSSSIIDQGSESPNKDQSFEVVKGEEGRTENILENNEAVVQENVVVTKHVEQKPSSVQVRSSRPSEELSKVEVTVPEKVNEAIKVVPIVEKEQPARRSTVETAAQENKKVVEQERQHSQTEAKNKDTGLLVETQAQHQAGERKALDEHKSSTELPKQSGKIVDYDTESDLENTQTHSSGTIKTTIASKNVSGKNKEVGDGKEKEGSCQLCNIF